MPRLMGISRLLLLGAQLAVASSTSQLTESNSRDNSGECECYLVSGDDQGYFQYHRFWDFRSLASDGMNDYTSAPPLVTSEQSQGGQDVTSAYFNTTSFNNDWSIQNAVLNDRDGPVSNVNSAQNIFITRNTNEDGSPSTYLTFRASRLPKFSSNSEMDSNQKNVLHASIRVRARVLPMYSGSSAPYIEDGDLSVMDGLNKTQPVSPGAVFGVFTYQSDTQESDIEILTSDPTNNVRYSNQPDFDRKTGKPVPGASTQVILPNNIVWTDWHEHRLDWFEGMTRWYIDGDLVLEKTINVPTKPSGLVLNLWSDGGDWSGDMSVGAEVTAGVEWIDMVFNTSGKVDGLRKRHEHRVCNVGCNLDGVQEIGHPTVAFNVTGSDNAREKSLGWVDGPLGRTIVMLWAVLVLFSFA